MEKILEIFSTREVAFFSWILIAIIAMNFGTEIRKSMIGVFKSLFATKVFLIILLLLFYVTTVIFFLWKINLWGTFLFKDTVFWFCSFALVTFFNINKAEDNSYFKSLLKECLKWTIFIEFLVNFYTFSLITELVMFPIVVFVGLIQAFSQTDKKHQVVTKLFTNILTLIGTIYFLYALYKTVVDYKTLFTTQNLFSLLMPIILTITILPFLYGLALFMKYETLYIRVRFMTNDNDKKNEIRKAIFSAAKLNLSKLKVIDKGLNKFDLYNSSDITKYIQQLVR